YPENMIDPEISKHGCGLQRLLLARSSLPCVRPCSQDHVVIRPVERHGFSRYRNERRGGNCQPENASAIGDISRSEGLQHHGLLCVGRHTPAVSVAFPSSVCHRQQTPANECYCRLSAGILFERLLRALVCSDSPDERARCAVKLLDVMNGLYETPKLARPAVE